MPNGVMFNEPPSDRIGPIMRAMNDAFASMSPDADAAIVGIANETGANAAVIVRAGKGFEVQAWIGKSWDGPMNYGAMVRKEIRF